MTLSVVTYNFGGAKSALDDLARYTVICCQEAGDRDGAIHAFLAAHPTWRKHDAGGRQGRGKTPILWDSARVTVTEAGCELMTRRTLSPKGAGGPWMDNKYAMWVVVDGVTVVNTHAVPSLRFYERLRLHRLHMERLAAFVRKQPGPVVAVGDFNATSSHRHFDGLRVAGFRLDSPRGVTHPKTGRRIDLVWTRGLPKPTARRRIVTGSDHRAVAVTWPVKAPVPPPETPEPEPPKEPDVPLNLDPLHRPLWRGRTNVDQMTIAAIEYAESLRRHPGSEFVVTQGSYQGGSGDPLSAGTHDLGGVVDLRWHGDNHDIWCLRKAGFAAWHRTPQQGPWPDHVHAVLGGHPKLARSAANQWDAYLRGRNGLANNGPDDGPRLDPIPRFTWPPEEDDMPLSDTDLDKIAQRVWEKEIGGSDNRKHARLHLIQAANAAKRAAAEQIDPAALAAAVVAAMPSGRKVDEATVVAGVKRALAELVNEE